MLVHSLNSQKSFHKAAFPVMTKNNIFRNAIVMRIRFQKAGRLLQNSRQSLTLTQNKDLNCIWSSKKIPKLCWKFRAVRLFLVLILIWVHWSPNLIRHLRNLVRFKNWLRSLRSLFMKVASILNKIKTDFGWSGSLVRNINCPMIKEKSIQSYSNPTITENSSNDFVYTLSSLILSSLIANHLYVWRWY